MFRALEVYTERHYRRVEELVDESYLVEFTLREMDEVIGTEGTNGMKGVEGGRLVVGNGVEDGERDEDVVMV